MKDGNNSDPVRVQRSWFRVPFENICRLSPEENRSANIVYAKKGETMMEKHDGKELCLHTLEL